jgi:hypothetical protein
MRFRSTQNLYSQVAFKISERDKMRLLAVAERPDVKRKPSELARLATMELIERLEKKPIDNSGQQYH